MDFFGDCVSLHLHLCNIVVIKVELAKQTQTLFLVNLKQDTQLESVYANCMNFYVSTSHPTQGTKQ